MNMETALKVIQDLRAGIDQWGVTAETLIALAGLALVMFVLSLREVLSWFLRVQALRDDVKSLRKDIAELKLILREKPLVIEEEVVVESATPELKKKEDEKPAKAFRLDH